MRHAELVEARSGAIISIIVEQVRWDLHSTRRSERRQHCLRGLKPQGPGWFGTSRRAEPVKSGELGPKAPCWSPSG